MKSTIKHGDWWHNCAIKTSVILADFVHQMDRHRHSGGNPKKYVYNATARLKQIRENKDVYI